MFADLLQFQHNLGNKFIQRSKKVVLLYNSFRFGNQ